MKKILGMIKKITEGKKITIEPNDETTYELILDADMINETTEKMWKHVLEMNKIGA